MSEVVVSGQDHSECVAVTEVTEAVAEREALLSPGPRDAPDTSKTGVPYRVTASASFRRPAYSSVAVFALAFPFLPLPLPCPVLFPALSDGIPGGVSIFVLGAGILAETF